MVGGMARGVTVASIGLDRKALATHLEVEHVFSFAHST
jgi:hypothetical protein